MAQSRMIGGVYHPRAKGGAMSDALADAKRAVNRLTRMVALRGAGLTLFLAAAAALIALVTYASDDASLNNANVRDVANWLGPLGAVLTPQRDEKAREMGLSERIRRRDVSAA